MISIIPYTPDLQDQIDQMMKDIQDEFTEQITTSHSTVIKNVYHLPDQHYWVATSGEKIVGTIGIVLYAHHTAVIKRMMVHKAYRGREFATATRLVDKATSWAKAQGAAQVYLGTMKQFIAAQKFYTRAGFKEIMKEDLPADYDPNPMDTLYYSKEI